jgi:peptidoglycan/LPS O-acetylase OafA/YrhL
MLVIGCILLFFCIQQVHFSNIKYEEIRSGQLFLMLTPLAFAVIIPKVEKMNFTLKYLSWLKVSIENISLWSYSIYLSHIPVMFTTYYLTSAIRINGMGNLASKLIGLFITIMISAFIYKYFEKPLTNKRPKEIIN